MSDFVRAMLAATPRPDLELAKTNRRIYVNTIEDRIHLRTKLLLQEVGIASVEELELARRLVGDPDFRDRLVAIAARTDHADLDARIAAISAEEWLEIAEQSRECALCPATDAEHKIPGTAGPVCEPCRDRFYARPSQPPANGIQSALRRARRAGLPATLTVAQWAATVAHFADRCAFCGGAWCLVEHATPIELGGGTTADNCLPACYSCNATKGKRQLTHWGASLPSDHLLKSSVDRALAWLAQNRTV